MTFSQSISTCMTKYVDFKGRATRSEYWWFYLFQILASACFSFLAGVLAAMLGLSEDGITALVVMLYLAIVLPNIAVTARRLHDVSRSGWWMLIPMTIVGIIPFYYWVCKAGDSQDNRYGAVA